MFRFFFIISFLFFAKAASAQNLSSNYRSYALFLSQDTIQLDSLSVLAETFSIKLINAEDTGQLNYTLDAFTAQLIIPIELLGQEVLVSYRTYPFLFTKKYFSKSYEKYKTETENTGFLISSAAGINKFTSTSGLIDFGTLDYNGNLSRGVGFGNAQSLNVNSSFNIQLAGMITDDIEVKAAITDNSIPIQPEGNTAQLQEFDKVFIQLRKDQHYLTVGDFDLVSPPSYFMKFQRNMQGASYKGLQEIEDKGIASGMASFAISRGKFVINNITAQEGNQGPYRLKGPNGETFIIVLGGSERVFINGVQQARGGNNDYVIDYNVGEITFTPNKMITQDMRIRVEFEYADRYYLRSLYHVNGGFEQEKFKIEANFFSQQDAKSQSLNQDLNDDRILILENAGDDLSNALASGINQVDFDAGRVLYEQKDTVINGVIDTFYVYSNDETKVLYSLTFSLIGSGLGGYEPVNSVANGRVFEYRGPGIGSYLPVIQLIAPQKQQLATTRFTYKANTNTNVGVELALSTNDLNSFSELDKQDNLGMGLNLFYDQKLKLKSDSLKTLQFDANYEFKQADFKPLERYRAVEFNRNFNFVDQENVHEHLATLSFVFTKMNKGSVSYRLSYLNRDTIYQGFENDVQTNYVHSGFENRNGFKYLYAKNGDLETQFMRPSFLLSKSYKKLKDWKTGITLNNEINKTTNLLTDSLNASSFLWQEYGVFIQNPDSARNQYSLSYKLRYQHIAKGKSFDKAYLKAQNVEFKGRFLSKRNHTINWNLSYRNLQQDTLFVANSDLEHFYLGRIDYGFTALKGAIRGSSLYEIGAGREQKIQYNYLENPNGQGSYAWSDINENGVQEINEFYVSTFNNENRFIRIFTNSLEFQPVNSTRFNQSLNLNPKAIWYNEKGIKDLIARFSTTTALQFNKKVFASKNIAVGDVLSPFELRLADSLLVATSTSVRNIIFFNRTDTKYGMDYTYQFSESKTLLTSGFERRKYILNTFNLRWNFINNFTINGNYTTGFKQNDSDFYFDRRYEYIINEAGGDLTWLFKSALRIELGYQYGFRSNPLPVTGGQFAVTNKVMTTIKYARPNNYSITGQFVFTSVGYNDDSFKNQQLEFDLLQGLQEGNNYVWNLAVDKTFAKLLQVSFQYDGRKTGNSQIVHGGRMQVRAIF